MNSEAIGAFEAARHAINEAIKAAEQPRTRRLGPNDEAWDDGYLNGIKACGCVVMAAIASAPQQAQETSPPPQGAADRDLLLRCLGMIPLGAWVRAGTCYNDCKAAIDRLAASPAPAPQEPAAKPCCEQVRTCVEACVVRANYWQGEAERLLETARKHGQVIGGLQHYASPAPGELGAASAGWVSVAERLPAENQPVALLDVERWENTGGDWSRNVQAAGYLASMGSVTYWAIRGERCVSLDAFSHWMPLPQPPQQAPSESSAQGSGGEKV